MMNTSNRHIDIYLPSIFYKNIFSGSQPWTASIRVKGTTKSFHWCGAVIISDRHLLTAAHCVEDYPKEILEYNEHEIANYIFKNI